MGETEFLVILSDDTRMRHFHITVGGKVVEFVIQVEILINDEWRPVIRYDTSHGYAHRDIINPDGSVSKTMLYVYDYNEALTYAEADVKSNWELYRERFLREVKQ